MPDYKIGDIVRLTRQSIGMTQEELCEGICEPQTISNIENGKTNPKRKIIKQLMERMGRNPDKSYAFMEVSWKY